ncbi:12709_t:CDS:10 [Ambispora gerdemannii]|uniref:12709_t:CDS:1 n=1 Tax=Ambispora gerdemannii TaxID=144530 RepID=A0A9N8ZGA6_9GLOM|nr:12709_t:CDS:10 [Ambispora gerdemannii]
MPTEKPFHHRASPALKQTNKPFKSKHATKNALKDKSKGKVKRVSIKNQVKALPTKADRRNTAKQQQQKRREALFKANRFFDGLFGAPKIVAVIPLCPDVKSYNAVVHIFGSINQTAPSHTKGVVILNAERFKQKVQFILLERNFIDILDACKVADFIVFVMSAEVEVDNFGEQCVKAIQAQGVPTVIAAVMHLELQSPKKRNDVKKSLLSFLNYFFPDEEKIHSLDVSQEALNVLRTICTQLPKNVHWRDTHPYMLADDVGFDANSEDENFGTLRVTGYARGNPFSANRLVHLQNFGDYQLIQVTSSPVSSEKANNEMAMDIKVLDVPVPDLQETLVAENEPDFMSNDQTWPTREELDEVRTTSMNSEDIPDAIPGTTPKRVLKRVPRGTSSYQAALREYMEKLSKQQRDDLEFPDEVDTPIDMPARTRFQRYRGLQSFHKSPWDPYENLPVDYSRIFEFSNYKRAKNRVLREASTEVVKTGQRITLHVANVSKAILEIFNSSRPFVVFGLLRYEHKMSVLNFIVTRNSEFEEPVKSKDPLILHCGFRRYIVRPLYSENTQGGKRTNNVHKFERFFNLGRTCMATIYGPIQMGNLPVMLYKDTGDVNAPILVATGTFTNVEPKRIIAKRICLTGYPFKVHKKSAVIRYMFFNSDDVSWFKPIQLTTKYGRTGHIRESLGTHGYMKCVFDAPIGQQDTIMMNLYKRVFPKWNSTILWRGGLEGKVEENNVQVITKEMDTQQ